MRDHEAFLRVLKQNSGDYSRCITGACRMLPHLSRKDVIQHARWDAERNDLLLKKRVAIKEWRTKQDAIRNRRANDAAVMEAPSSRLVKMQEKVRKADERRFRDEQRYELENWWREKADEVDIMRAQRAKEEAERDRKKRAERALQVAKKEAVQLYRQQKLLEIEARRAKEEEERKASSSSVVRREERKRAAEKLKMLQQHDMNFVQQRREALASAKKAAAEREARQRHLAQKLGFTAERDASRLLRMTKAQAERAKPVDDEEKATRTLAPAPRIQHKIIPTWRRGL